MSMGVLGHLPRDWPTAHRCTEPHWCEDQKAPNSEQGTIQWFYFHHVRILFYPFPLPGYHVSELSPDYSSSGWRRSRGHRKEGAAWLHFRQHYRVLVKASVKAKLPRETLRGLTLDFLWPGFVPVRSSLRWCPPFWTIQYWRLRGKSAPPISSHCFLFFRKNYFLKLLNLLWRL